MITDELLLGNGYKEWEVNKLFHPYANRFFQKRFRNGKGQTQYFINFTEYGGEDDPYKYPINYEVNLTFEKEKYAIKIKLYAIDDNMTLEEIEKEVYAIWYGLDCKYYDYEEE